MEWLKKLVSKLFKWNRVPLETKLQAIIDWLECSSYRKASKKLRLQGKRASKSSIWEWVNKLAKAIELRIPKKEREFVAMDETCFKANGAKVFIYSALDVEERICLGAKVFTSRNYFTTSLFLEKVMVVCKNKPTFLVDKGPWYKEVFESRQIPYQHVTWGKRNLVERFFGSLKQRTRLFFNNINVNFKLLLKRMEAGLRDGVAMQRIDLFLKLFVHWFNETGKPRMP